MNFEEVWKDLKAALRDKQHVRTLARGNLNKIVRIGENSIVVQNTNTLAEREIAKGDFEYAWKVLESKGKLYMTDLAPELHGRKAIVMALLNELSYVSHFTKPLSLQISGQEPF